MNAAGAAAPAILASAVLLLAGCRAKEAAEQPLPAFYSHVAEALPAEIESRQNAFDAAVAAAAEAAARSEPDIVPYSVILRDYRRWAPGSIITVAFPKNPSATPDEQQLRADIEQIVTAWTGPGAASVSFSFRTPDNRFREWSVTDPDYAADVRITFSGRDFWSAMGRMSREPQVIRKNEASMMLGGFLVDRPSNWHRVVLHEFGHVLGFAHEHQNANVKCGFRYDDDPGYQKTQLPNKTYVPDAAGRRPGLYTWFSGYPNFWGQSKVDFNLGPLGTTPYYVPADFQHDPYDSRSIMKYYFEPEFFVQGSKSPCYAPEAELLSAQDKSTAARAYALSAINDQRLEALRIVLESPEVASDVHVRTASELSTLRAKRATAGQN